MDEKDDFMYIELMDTIALDRASSLQHFDIIYETLLKQDRSITRCSTKIPKNKLVKESFKYEYYEDSEYNKVSGNLGLFGLDNIMAYIFVFDVYDNDSFENVFTFAKSLQAMENSKDAKDKSLKYFIGNKYDFPIVDETVQINMSKDHLFQECKDNQENLYDEFSKRIKSEFLGGKHNDNEIKIEDCLFFCSAKYGTNVFSIFNKIYDNILQKENLYKKHRYEDSIKKVDSDDDNGNKIKKTVKKSDSGFFSCCSCRERNEDEEKTNEKTSKKKIKNRETIDESDDDSEDDKNIPDVDYHQNVQLFGKIDEKMVVFDGYSKEDKIKRENKNNSETNSGCSIF